jgi:hypothetical protein
MGTIRKNGGGMRFTDTVTLNDEDVAVVCEYSHTPESLMWGIREALTLDDVKRAFTEISVYDEIGPADMARLANRMEKDFVEKREEARTARQARARDIDY